MYRSPLLACTAGLLVGCAVPASELPKHVSRTQESGFSTASATPETESVSATKTASAPQAIKVLQSAWDALSTEERATLQQKYVIDLRDPSAYALTIDNQGVNESTVGTNDGAVLGGVVGSALYIDRAFKPGNNYSVGAQLAAGLLGAMIGSALDKPAVQQYHFRYAIKRHDGEIEYRDSVQSDAFRHPAGMCVELATLSPASQGLCTQTAGDVRKKYLSDASAQVSPAIQQGAAQRPKETLATPSALGQIDCKLGNLAPVSTTPEKCNAIGGKPL